MNPTFSSQPNLENRLKTIDSACLKDLQEKQQVVLVDVREADEYKREKIPGSIRVSLSNFDPNQIPTVEDKQLVLHCQTGNRSTQAAQKLFTAGYSEVTHLQGGLNAWKACGYQTQINHNAPISIMRQVQIVAGSLVLSGVLLGTFVAPGFYILSGFVGAGLMFAGITNTCAMATLLAKLPYNQKS
ncbi:MAG: rhodanese-like domain-containing protein [Xenococcaceae cyanobacterium MO_167.B27]|nr:rhodanese-like domain-containing protein [Xenococcaceae cyanobacterium MO_167.B27]